MKKILSLAIALVTVSVVMAQPPNVPADKGAKFGADITAEKAVPVADMVKSLKGKEGEKVQVKVQGEVVQVCEAEGCWLRMKNGDGTIMVRMKDHKFFVPTVMNGKTIVVAGEAQLKETSVAQLRHYAEDAGKSKEEIEKIKEPKKEVVLQADGIVVL
ncbi:DUF4920 domain-containing protein [Aridibaculum aurantiacum]|uniref:DUF4920 domain-containing protein n=1 Tax=Aridibaculum aurantiacum TaxID=2810307 RepID=UPI001A96B09C|nr:DUF4920 domain-containing protein [Aridibaculum aurantiacum]